MLPLASSVPVSPRRDTILPVMRTVLPMNCSRYWAFMRGVESDAMGWMRGGLCFFER